MSPMHTAYKERQERAHRLSVLSALPGYRDSESLTNGEILFYDRDNGESYKNAVFDYLSERGYRHRVHAPLDPIDPDSIRATRRDLKPWTYVIDEFFFTDHADAVAVKLSLNP